MESRRQTNSFQGSFVATPFPSSSAPFFGENLSENSHFTQDQPSIHLPEDTGEEHKRRFTYPADMEDAALRESLYLPLPKPSHREMADDQPLLQSSRYFADNGEYNWIPELRGPSYVDQQLPLEYPVATSVQNSYYWSQSPQYLHHHSYQSNAPMNFSGVPQDTMSSPPRHQLLKSSSVKLTDAEAEPNRKRRKSCPVKKSAKPQSSASSENISATIVCKVKKTRSRERTSKYRGVSKCSKDGRWQARIRVDKAVKYLGRFKIEKDAAFCYDRAAIKFHGHKAIVNFPMPLRHISVFPQHPFAGSTV